MGPCNRLALLIVCLGLPALTSAQQIDLYQEVYDVSDFLVSPVNHPAPQLGWQDGPSPEPTHPGSDRREQFLSQLKQHVTPGEWTREGRLLRLEADKLHVKATLESHAQLQKRLTALREASGNAVTYVHAFLIPYSPSELVSLGPTEELGSSSWTLSLNDLYVAVRGRYDKKVWEVELVLLEGHLTHGVLIQCETTAGRLQLDPTSDQLEPKVGVLNLGLTLEVGLRTLPGGGRLVRWQADTARKHGGRIIRDAAGECTELAEVEIRQVQGQSEVLGDHGFAVRGLRVPGETRECVLFVAPLDRKQRGPGLPLPQEKDLFK